ncbi:MAG: fumarate hydratase, partial [Thaumarchaeota archaeon]
MNEIEEAVRRLILDTFSNLDELEERYRQALEREESELGREVFKILLENLVIARRRRIPVCQDTGVAVI